MTSDEPLDERIESTLRAARRAAPPWSPARQQQLIWAVKGKLLARRRLGSTLLVAAALAAAMALLGVGLGRLGRTASETAARAPAPGTERWDLRDGSRIEIETPSTSIKKKLESPRELAFDLEAGSARFDVSKKPERTFRVDVGSVSVRVLGTSFRVERQRAECKVAVERGRVRVSWAGGERELTAGESGHFPLEAGPRVAAESAGTPALAAPAREDGSENAAPAAELAHGRAGPTASSAEGAGELTAEGLFASADRARSEGRPAEAVRHLRAITERFPRNPRAPLAAFTRGRLLLESLARPGEAASAFAQARALSSRSSALAEDALAREVEAHRAAGNLRIARERAELYRKSYPHGLRHLQVLRSVGLSGDR